MFIHLDFPRIVRIDRIQTKMSIDKRNSVSFYSLNGVQWVNMCCFDWFYVRYVSKYRERQYICKVYCSFVDDIHFMTLFISYITYFGLETIIPLVRYSSLSVHYQYLCRIHLIVFFISIVRTVVYVKRKLRVVRKDVKLFLNRYKELLLIFICINS